MSDRSNVRPATVLGFALGGVLVGHALTYLVLVPDAHARTAELSATGHGYLGGANAFGLVAVIAALAVLFFRGLAGADGSAPRVYERLAAFQLTAFAAMEILERLGSGVGLRHLVPTLAVGLPVQLAVSAFVALLVRFVARTAAAVADRVADGAPVWSSGAVTLIAGPPMVVAFAPAGGPPPGRAPPILFVR
jgi:hypothetical protein